MSVVTLHKLFYVLFVQSYGTLCSVVILKWCNNVNVINLYDFMALPLSICAPYLFMYIPYEFFYRRIV